mmetsp:Transcript_33865/g.104868  ORF Transcript_33865/g.104868 Transcript_33865/m.104868 type:complete len:143 (+) Transcript_33865:179-607(+)
MQRVDPQQDERTEQEAELLCSDSPGAACASIELTEQMPEPGGFLNCARDTTDDSVRYERRYAARPPAVTARSAFANASAKRYGVDRSRRAGYGYRPTPTNTLAGLVFAVLVAATLFAMVVLPRRSRGGGHSFPSPPPGNLTS